MCNVVSLLLLLYITLCTYMCHKLTPPRKAFYSATCCREKYPSGHYEIEMQMEMAFPFGFAFGNGNGKFRLCVCLRMATVSCMCMGFSWSVYMYISWLSTLTMHGIQQQRNNIHIDIVIDEHILLIYYNIKILNININLNIIYSV